MFPIDWSLLGKSADYYNDCGYKYIEAPWIVQQLAVTATLPPGRTAFNLNGSDKLGYLVGSAEQGFIQLILNSSLPNGRYHAIGPCFRDEVVDDWHFLYFMKLELIHIGVNSVEAILDCAKYFMEKISNSTINIEKTSDGFDLVYKGIEIGSYGFREYGRYSWTYGTGLALPRFNQVMKL